MLSTLRAKSNNASSYATAGAVVSIPILAVAQGVYYLTNFRRNHGDAPYPVSPSRGIVIVSPHKDHSNNNSGDGSSSSSSSTSTSTSTSYHNQLHMKNIHDKWLSTWEKIKIINRSARGITTNNTKHDTDTTDSNNPLRIFVVGDSLAAGVGSTRGTPVLPEAIARSLSKALGGRPVHWTCHGTPGASTSRIMKDIQEFTSDDYDSLIIDQDGHGQRGGADGHGNEEDDVVLETIQQQWNELKEVIVEHVKNVLQSFKNNKKLKWTKRLLQEKVKDEEQSQKHDNNDNNDNNNRHHLDMNESLALAISESRSKINAKINDILHAIRNKTQRRLFRRLTRRDSDHQQEGEDSDNIDDNEKAEWKQWNTNLSKSTILKRKDMAQYDVVVVLTGLNDLKSIFLPFMIDRDVINNGTFKEELRKVFYLLTGKKYQQRGNGDKVHHSAFQNEQHQDDDDDDDDDENRALVVVPALPTRVLPMLQYPPLCWIIHTLFHLIDEEKRALSKEYPGSLLFIEAPTIEMIDEIEKGKYFLCAQRKTETVLLALKDVTMRVRDEMEGLIKKHIQNHDFKDSDKEIELHYEASKHHNLTDSMPDAVGSKLVSIDKIHPNDDGYDFWGRHIAEGIIQELKLKNKRC